MAGYDPSEADMTASQQAAIRAKAVALLKGAGLRPDTPNSVIEEMLKLIDPADVAGTLTAIKNRWPQHFGQARSADKLAAQLLGR